MSTINTTFSFKDQVSQGLVGLDNNLKNINATLLLMVEKMDKANKKIRDTGDDADKASKKLGGLFTKLINFNQMKMVFDTVAGAISKVGESISECSNLYNFQIEQETKLEQVMRKHMNASEEQIQMIKDATAQQQSKGIFGDEMQMAGLQELATYVDDAETLKGLLPVLNSMVAQGAGTGATVRDMQSYATMMGKVMQGQVGGMSKRGYSFSDEEEEILKTGTQMQKLAVLQNAVLGGFGDMNEALRQTPQGQIIALNNDIGDMKEQIGQSMIPFTQMFTLATGEWKMSWLTFLNNGLKFVTEHAVGVKIALIGIAVAIGTIATAYAVYHSAQIKAIALQMKELAVSIAKFVVQHAQLFLIIGAIFAVITVIGVLLAYSEKVFPAIGGFIGGIAGIAQEVGAQIKYYFGLAIEGVVNGFLKLKKTVVNSFLTLFDFLLSGVEKIAKALDKVFGTSFADDISSFRNTLKAMKDEKQEKFTLGWEDNRKGFANAWREGKEAGSQVGAGLSDKLQGWLGNKKAQVQGMFPQGGTNADEIGGGVEDGLKNTFKFSGNGTLSVSDKNLVNIADDYRELLSKRATERFNLQYKSITPTVNINNVDVHKEVDAGEAISQLAYKMAESAGGNLSGVA